MWLFWRRDLEMSRSRDLNDITAEDGFDTRGMVICACCIVVIMAYFTSFMVVRPNSCDDYSANKINSTPVTKVRQVSN